MRVRKKLVAEAAKNWITLNEVIGDLTKEEVLLALEEEKKREQPRRTFIKRLNQRYNGIREAEIREEPRHGKSD